MKEKEQRKIKKSNSRIICASNKKSSNPGSSLRKINNASRKAKEKQDDLQQMRKLMSTTVRSLFEGFIASLL
jgi:hypothetical protein